jgi:hypothetical protein
VPLKTYDEAIGVLQRSLEALKIDEGQKLEGFRRLNQFIEIVETGTQSDVDLPGLIEYEEAISPSLKGRSVAGKKVRSPRPAQMGFRF